MENISDEVQRIELERPEQREILRMIFAHAAHYDPRGEKQLLKILAAIYQGRTMREVARATGMNYDTLKSCFRRFSFEMRREAAAASRSDEDQPRGEGVHGA